MIEVHDVASVRAAEAAASAALPTGTLMARASFALAVACAALLVDVRGAVVGSRVVLLVGSGDNGGDALWCGAHLARRGCAVDAVLVSGPAHDDGVAALLAAGGRLHRWDDAADVLAAADLVIDGIVGIGGRGGLRDSAAEVHQAVRDGDAPVVAVDLPSGVDADTGEVAGVAVDADLTVTFGAIKPGLVLSPGAARAGGVRLVDIGLDLGEPTARILESVDVAAWLPEPAGDAYKYRRGVVGLAVGSAAYPGAALLAVGGASHVGAGMVRVLDRRDGIADAVLAVHPEVVVDGADPATQDRVTAWACGSGFGGDDADRQAVLAVCASSRPVVLDAGALGLLASHADVRDAVRMRAERGQVTVVTPHEGEFERLVPGLLERGGGRLAAAREAAARLGAVVVLKGPGTVIAAPDGIAWIDAEGTADLATAGSGDVLTGILGAILAMARAHGASDGDLTEAVAAGVWLHSCAGRLASAPVVATDLVAQVGAAVRVARFGEDIP